MTSGRLRYGSENVTVVVAGMKGHSAKTINIKSIKMNVFSVTEQNKLHLKSHILNFDFNYKIYFYFQIIYERYDSKLLKIMIIFRSFK